MKTLQALAMGLTGTAVVGYAILFVYMPSIDTAAKALMAGAGLITSYVAWRKNC